MASDLALGLVTNLASELTKAQNCRCEKVQFGQHFAAQLLRVLASVHSMLQATDQEKACRRSDTRQ
jgi:hypothetical protein